MNNIETELIGSEISHDWSYLKPITRATWKQRIADTLALVAILALAGSLLWLASIGAL